MDINIEQMEAEEINEKPRIVITAEKVYFHKEDDSTGPSFNRDQMLAIGGLMELLKKAKESPQKE